MISNQTQALRLGRCSSDHLNIAQQSNRSQFILHISQLCYHEDHSLTSLPNNVHCAVMCEFLTPDLISKFGGKWILYKNTCCCFRYSHIPRRLFRARDAICQILELTVIWPSALVSLQMVHKKFYNAKFFHIKFTNLSIFGLLKLKISVK